MSGQTGAGGVNVDPGRGCVGPPCAEAWVMHALCTLGGPIYLSSDCVGPWGCPGDV